jgi:2'-5' RNA ligase
VSIIVGPTLPEPYYSTVKHVWADLDSEFGFGRMVNPFPHFTLYGLDDADVDAVERVVEDVAANHDPVSVRTDGLGVFQGNHVYIPVTHSRALGDLHHELVGELRALGAPLMPFYEPDSWFPHVGLALAVDDEQVGDVVSFLVDYDFAWEFTVDNVEVESLADGMDQFERVASVDL